MNRPILPLSRRHVLKSILAAILLPPLESFGVQVAAADAPKRLVWLVMPNGVLPESWDLPEADGKLNYSPTLEPLQRHRDKVNVYDGLWNRNSRSGDGHYAKVAPLLTGVEIRRTGGRDLLNGESADQTAARMTAGATLLPSLELGTEPVHRVEDMGYSTVYGGHIAWKNAALPLAKEISPRRVFDRILRTASWSTDGTGRSVLDVISRDLARINGDLSRHDRVKLDEYTESVRDVERRIHASEKDHRAALDPNGLMSRPAETPRDFTEHLTLMFDLITLAFRIDVTRIVTFLLGNEVTGRDFSFIEGVQGTHHELSHHENKPEKKAMYALINRWYLEQFARLIDRFKSTQTGPDNRSLLDSSILVFAGAMKDGNAHEPRNLPVVSAGSLGGALRTGRVLRYPKSAPLCGLWLGLLQGFGLAIDRFGDADRVIENFK